MPGNNGGTSIGGGIMVELGGALSFAGAGGTTATGTSGKTGNSGAPGPILKSGETATGCNCRVGGEKPASGLAWLTAALGLAALARRRK